METWLPIIIQLVAGALGGNWAGSAMKNRSLGTTGNSIVGIIGGIIVGQLLPALGLASGGSNLDIGSILTSVIGGGAGGGILLAIIGLLRGGSAKAA